MISGRNARLVDRVSLALCAAPVVRRRQRVQNSGLGSHNGLAPRRRFLARSARPGPLRDHNEHKIHATSRIAVI